ncbi:MAG: hypothetical protein WCI62_04460 [Erysipelotrichaceae bacterium]
MRILKSLLALIIFVIILQYTWPLFVLIFILIVYYVMRFIAKINKVKLEPEAPKDPNVIDATFTERSEPDDTQRN